MESDPEPDEILVTRSYAHRRGLRNSLNWESCILIVDKQLRHTLPVLVCQAQNPRLWRRSIGHFEGQVGILSNLEACLSSNRPRGDGSKHTRGGGCGGCLD